MVAIGLLGVPPEIQLRIAEFVETSQALKALSVTSRSLRSIAQSMLFESLQIDLGMEPRGSVDDLLANPRICAAIRFLRLRGRFLSSRAPRNDDEQLSLIQKILSEMVGLRKVVIYHVNLSKPFLDAFLGIAASTPLRIHLGWNIYPYSVIPTPHMPLQISHLHLAVDHPSLELYRSMFHASVATLTELVIAADGDELMKLAGINLPFLHDLILVFMTGNEISRTSAVAFITAQKAIRRLHLKRTMRPLSPIPPNALPNLRELKASAEQLSQFVPGRPVEAIEIISSQPECDQDWFVEEVGQSTARVRLLRVSLTTPILDTRMVKRMVTVLPFLESLWLPVSNDTLLSAVEVLTSLKFLKDLHFNLLRRTVCHTVWVDLSINDIATKLRNANSCFSRLEVRNGGWGGWKDVISVWNEVFGVFQLHRRGIIHSRKHLNQSSTE